MANYRGKLLIVSILLQIYSTMTDGARAEIGSGIWKTESLPTQKKLDSAYSITNKSLKQISEHLIKIV